MKISPLEKTKTKLNKLLSNMKKLEKWTVLTPHLESSAEHIHSALNELDRLPSDFRPPRKTKKIADSV